MQVFKLYLKLIKKNSSSLFIYLGAFIGIVVVITSAQFKTPTSDFKPKKINMAYINLDGDTTITKGLKNYLEDKVNFVDIEKEEIRDGLFFRAIEYALIIPEGFSNDFINNKNPILQKLSIPESSSSAFMDINIENYLNTLKVYKENTDLSLEEISPLVMKDLKTNISVNMISTKGDNKGVVKQYFDYVAYALSSVLVFGISAIMVSTKNVDIARRNRVSPLSIKTQQTQQVASFFAFVFALDLLLIGIGIFLNKGVDYSLMMYSINTVVFSFAMLSVAYLAGISVKTREASDGIANIVSLSFSFLGGVFVPIEYLGKPATSMGRFTPTYWFTMANGYIRNGLNSITNFQSFLISMGIQLGFAIAILSIALVVNKMKATAEN